MSDTKAVLLGLSALGGVLAALQSRSSRKKANATLRRRPSTSLEGTAPPINGAPIPIQPQVSLQHAQTSGRFYYAATTSNFILILHGLVSIALLSLAAHLKPPSFPEEGWRQLVGSISITVLATHVIILLVLSRRRSRVRAPPLPIQPVALVQASPLHGLDAMVGVYTKDKEASDSMDSVCDLMQIHGIIRMAIGLIKGVEIGVAPVADTGLIQFRFAVLSGIMWFKIKECYLVGGEETKHRRRDMRGGGSFGRARVAVNGGLAISHRFGAPNAGTMEERFYCPEPGVLYVDTKVSVEGRGNVTYRQVYRKNR